MCMILRDRKRDKNRHNEKTVVLVAETDLELPHDLVIIKEAG